MTAQFELDGCTVTVEGQWADKVAEQLQVQGHWLEVCGRLGQQLMKDNERLRESFQTIKQELR